MTRWAWLYERRVRLGEVVLDAADLGVQLMKAWKKSVGVTSDRMKVMNDCPVKERLGERKESGG